MYDNPAMRSVRGLDERLLKSGDFVERKNGNVERKKVKKYAKDSAIAGAANANPRMKSSGGFSYCDFHNLPGEINNILRTGFPSSKAMAMCEGAKIAACKGKKGRKKKKCIFEWAKCLEVFLSTTARVDAGAHSELSAPGGPRTKCNRGFDGKCLDIQQPEVTDVCEELRRGKIKPNAAHYSVVVEACKG
jgi:hypothetical protein